MNFALGGVLPFLLPSPLGGRAGDEGLLLKILSADYLGLQRLLYHRPEQETENIGDDGLSQPYQGHFSAAFPGV